MNGHEIPDEAARRIRRLAPGAAPEPTPALASFLAMVTDPSLLTDKGDLPATAASNVHGPVRAQVSGLPKRRSRMKELLLAGTRVLAQSSIVAKVAVGSVAMAAAGLGTAGAVSYVVHDQQKPPAVVQQVDPADEGTTVTPSDEPSDPSTPDTNQADNQGDGQQATSGGNQGDSQQATSEDNQGDSQQATSEDNQGDNNNQGGNEDNATSSDHQGGGEHTTSGDSQDNQGDSQDSVSPTDRPSGDSSGDSQESSDSTDSSSQDGGSGD